MAVIPSASIENNFTAGLKTEFTGLNFPENAATDADNVVFEYTGDVVRRLGIDYENNYSNLALTGNNNAVTLYKWNNAGGDGSTQLIVQQFGGTLYFYKSSAATTSTSISANKLVSTVTLGTFLVIGSSLPVDNIQCEFADGNGYLFVYHPSLEPFYCTYDPTAQTVTGNGIKVQIRDFEGISEGLGTDKVRPPTLTAIHRYNLQNQGWTSGGSWTTTSTSNTTNVGSLPPGSYNFTVAAGLTISIGTVVNMLLTTYYSPGGTGTYLINRGVVSAYSGTTLTMSVSSVGSLPPGGNYPQYWTFYPISIGYIDKWFTDTGRYPSNSDVWWNFKNASNVFDPAGTIANVTLSSPAPKGSYILSAFNQSRTGVSTVAGLADITTNVRPRTGTWFQGRVWYAGIDAYQSENLGVSPFYTWTENIYFSQIIQTTDQFGLCFQTNDPTSEELFALLPTDGGVIKIQGSGAIYKLFPIQNGMLVFAANGIWFITGSQGIGFTANDYTITKISNIPSISSTSFVNVQGLPMFWNEDGIYTVQPAQQGLGLTVNTLTYNSIDTLYSEIPVLSKKYVRGAYNEIDYTVEWLYRATAPTTVGEYTSFDRMLVFNTKTQSFAKHSFTIGTPAPAIRGILYVNYPGAATSPEPSFKYLTSLLTTGSTRNYTFSELKSENYSDWDTVAGAGVYNYDSYFVTGYKIRGQAQRRWQTGYVLIYSRNEEDTSYKIQAIFDYASSPNSGRWSSNQVITNSKPDYSMVVRRHKLRGQGYAGQIRVSSVDGEPFDIMGWSIFETTNSGV